MRVPNFKTRYLFTLIIATLVIHTSVYPIRHALIIGQNQGGSDVETLRYSESDAQKFAHLLMDLSGFNSGDITLVLHTDSASLQGHFNQAMEQFARFGNKPGDDDLFLFYYSGHADQNALKLGNTHYPLKVVKDFISQIPASVRIGIFDACQSGAVTQFKGGERGQPFYLKQNSPAKGQVIIASSAANEMAQESNTLKGSVFSHHWFNGLRGSADFSGDKKVTLTEAYRYAYRKTVETTALTGGGIQHPSYKFNIHGQGEIELTDLSQGSGGLFLGPEFEGKYLILSEDYTDVLADFFKESDRDIFINLEPGAYTLIYADNRETHIHRFPILQGSTYSPSPDSLKLNPRVETTLKGANQNAKKRLEYTTSPLSTYAWGAGLGAVSPLNLSLSEKGDIFKLQFANSLYIQRNVELFMDLNWVLADPSLGLDVGFDYVPMNSRFRPFGGMGLGIHTFPRSGQSYREALGPSVTAHLGFMADIGRRLQLQLRVPYHLTLNKDRDQILGFEIRLMFSGPYRDVKVLHY